MTKTPTLDPVTFEVLKNSFITAVDQMAEQILRTCYSFVIYNRDFSSALHDAKGEYRSFTREGAVPKVEVNDPLKPHLDLLSKYTDADIHNVTAYLVTLK